MELRADGTVRSVFRLQQNESMAHCAGIEVYMGEHCDLAEAVRTAFSLKKEDIRSYSPLVLAFIGDGIYDIIIRTILVEKGNAQVNKLHRKASGYVKAQAQRELFHAVEGMLTEEERSVFRRGRNANSATTAKNASISDYRAATGLEALFGYLYLTGSMERIFELVRAGIPGIAGTDEESLEGR